MRQLDRLGRFSNQPHMGQSLDVVDSRIGQRLVESRGQNVRVIARPYMRSHGVEWNPKESAAARVYCGGRAVDQERKPSLSILGGIGTHQEDVMHMKRTADRLFGDDYRWSVLGAGRHQVSIATASLLNGGNVRVGLEDSLWAGRGRIARSNAEQVLGIRDVIEKLGLEVANAAEARITLDLKGGDRVAF